MLVLKMWSKILVVGMILAISSSAFSFPALGARVRTLSGYPSTKVVDFYVRNHTDRFVDGYFYVIKMYDRNNREILVRGRRLQGYRETNLHPGERTRERERILVECAGVGSPVRVDVDISLISPTLEGDDVLQ